MFLSIFLGNVSIEMGILIEVPVQNWLFETIPTLREPFTV